MKKIPTLFVRDFENHHGRYVTQQVTPGCEWVLEGEGVVTRKWDGTCIRVGDDGQIWARREVKVDRPAPPRFIEVEHDIITGKTVGWEPASQSAFATLVDEAYRDEGPGTYELVGPKVNGNHDEVPRQQLIRHGALATIITDRTYDGIRHELELHPMWEGVVFWRVAGDLEAGLAKIKRRDFPELS